MNSRAAEIQDDFEAAVRAEVDKRMDAAKEEVQQQVLVGVTMKIFHRIQELHWFALVLIVGLFVGIEWSYNLIFHGGHALLPSAPMWLDSAMLWYDEHIMAVVPTAATGELARRLVQNLIKMAKWCWQKLCQMSFNLWMRLTNTWLTRWMRKIYPGNND